jgi:hypothetical protein
VASSPMVRSLPLHWMLLRRTVGMLNLQVTRHPTS